MPSTFCLNNAEGPLDTVRHVSYCIVTNPLWSTIKCFSIGVCIDLIHFNSNSDFLYKTVTRPIFYDFDDIFQNWIRSVYFWLHTFIKLDLVHLFPIRTTFIKLDPYFLFPIPTTFIKLDPVHLFPIPTTFIKLDPVHLFPIRTTFIKLDPVHLFPIPTTFIKLDPVHLFPIPTTFIKLDPVHLFPIPTTFFKTGSGICFWLPL